MKLVLRAAEEPPSFSLGSRAGWESFPLQILHLGALAQRPPQSCAVPWARTGGSCRALTLTPVRALGSLIPTCAMRAQPCSRDSMCRDTLLWVLALLAVPCFGGTFFPLY